MYDRWGAFRDGEIPRCYAIAMPQPSSGRQDYAHYAGIATYPHRVVRNKLHVRLARRVAPNAPITLSLGAQRFVLTGGGGDAWAPNRQTDAAIVAAMRSASSMIISARDGSGRRFSSTYLLSGAVCTLASLLFNKLETREGTGGGFGEPALGTVSAGRAPSRSR